MILICKNIISSFASKYNLRLNTVISQLAGVVEYTDCTSEKG